MFPKEATSVTIMTALVSVLKEECGKSWEGCIFPEAPTPSCSPSNLSFPLCQSEEELREKSQRPMAGAWWHGRA
jgi:hypothetical protein